MIHIYRPSEDVWLVYNEATDQAMRLDTEAAKELFGELGQRLQEPPEPPQFTS